ncbi:transcription factor 12-like isoform X4 [Glandiceps talaboti]
MQNPPSTRLGSYGTSDKELNDLLDFSAMFSPPTGVGGPKNGAPPSTLEHRGVQGPHYKTGMVDESRNSWSSSSQPSPSFDSRGYEGSSYNDHMNDRGMLNNNMSNPYDMNSNNSSMSSFMGKPMEKSYQMPYSSMSREPGMPPSQVRQNPGMSSMGSEMPLSSPNSLSPQGKRGSPYPYGYNSSARRPLVPESSRIPGGPSAKRPRGLSAVDSPSGSYDPYSQDSPRYTSPKPPGLYPEFMDGSHGSPDTWHQNGMPPSTSGYTSAMISSNTQSSYGNLQPHPHPHHQPPPPHEMGYGHPMSPSNHEPLSMHPTLPPMSTFRGNPQSGSTPYTSTGSPMNGSESIIAGGGRNSVGPTPGSGASGGGGGGGGGSQTGDTLGKALASIYQPDHTSSSFPSNPSTPVGSPAPMTATAQWPRPSSQTSPGPYVESHLHSLQSRMEERLDDAINVLRTHAEGMLQSASPGGMGVPGMGGGILGHHPHHPNGAMDSHMGHGTPHGQSQYEAMVQSQMSGSGPPHHGQQPMPDDGGTNRLRNSVGTGPTTTPEIAQPQQPFNAVQTEILSPNGNQGEGVKIEKIDQKKHKKSLTSSQDGGKSEQGNLHEVDDFDDDDDDDGSVLSQGGSGRSKKSRTTDDDPPEVKIVRERERRHANNARERIRVRDINEAFKELGRMCALHLKSDKAQTKLCILHQAVNVITSLEQQVRERNLNPKAACLKRREEEKVDELPNRAITGGPSAAEQALSCSNPGDGRCPQRTQAGLPSLKMESFAGVDIFESRNMVAMENNEQITPNIHVDAARISPTVSSTSSTQPLSSPLPATSSSSMPLTHVLPTDPYQTSPRDDPVPVSESASVQVL